MKHTNFSQKISEIEQQEYKELLRAVQLHGGCVEWNSDEDIEGPLIAVNPESCAPEPVDVNIYRVEIVDNRLKFYGQNKNNDEEVDFDEDGIFTGGLSAIIDYIPAINGINDVSSNSTHFNEALADISYFLGQEQVVINNNSRAFNYKAIEWANDFFQTHKNTNWDEIDYVDTIYNFTQNKISEYQGLIYHNCPYCGHDIMRYDRDETKIYTLTLTCIDCYGEINGTNASHIFSESDKVSVLKR